MTRNSIKSSALLLLALLMAGASWAQDLRPTETLYFTPRVGVSNYYGDNDPDFDFDEWSVDKKIPFYGGLEIGYQYTKTFALGFGVGITDLPTSAGPNLGPVLGQGGGGRGYTRDENSFKYPFYLVGRLQSAGNFSPYIEAGAGAAISVFNRVGDLGNVSLAYGPQFGLGFDYFFNPRTAFTVGVQSSAGIPGRSHRQR